MPKFIQEILEMHKLNQIEEFEIEIPDFPDEEIELNFEDAFIPENIVTM